MHLAFLQKPFFEQEKRTKDSIQPNESVQCMVNIFHSFDVRVIAPRNEKRYEKLLCPAKGLVSSLRPGFVGILLLSMGW